jgi:hypothetical protein
MKKILIPLTAIAILALSSCATSRRPSSAIFTCHFKAKAGDAERSFEFIPDDHSLIVDKADIALEESDFASGSFVYKTRKSEKDWKGELIFVSYEKRPQVYLKFQKSPLSSELISIVRECE